CKTSDYNKPLARGLPRPSREDKQSPPIGRGNSPRVGKNRSHLVFSKSGMPQDFLARLNKAPILCDGAMGTLLYAKGIFINRSYDELNLSQPDLIRSVHQDYLHSGAEIIETNTFG